MQDILAKGTFNHFETFPNYWMKLELPSSLTSFLFQRYCNCKKMRQDVQLRRVATLSSCHNGAEFHQRSRYSFQACGAQKRKKDSQVVSLFTLLGSTSVKAEYKYVGEIEPGSQLNWFQTGFCAFL